MAANADGLETGSTTRDLSRRHLYLKPGGVPKYTNPHFSSLVARITSRNWRSDLVASD